METVNQTREEQQTILEGEVLDTTCDTHFYNVPRSGDEWTFIKCSSLVLHRIDEFLEQSCESYSVYSTKKENYHEAIAYMENQGFTVTKECQCPKVDIAAIVQRADEAEIRLIEVEKRFARFAELIEELVRLFYVRFNLWHFNFFTTWNICGSHIDTVKSVVTHFQKLHSDQDYFYVRFRQAFEGAGLKEPRKHDELEF